MILGSRGALAIALMVVGISMAIGVPLGLFAGYYQGWASETIMRITDVFLAVPQLILALALAQLMGPSLQSAMLALTLTYWPFFTRIVYAEARRLRGVPFHRCAAVHRRPRPPHPVSAHPAQLHLAHHRARHHRHGLHDPGRGGARLSRHGRDAAGSRLGPGHLGEPAIPAGRLVVSTFPGLAIFLTVLGFNLLGDGLRDIVDPRLRRSR